MHRGRVVLFFVLLVVAFVAPLAVFGADPGQPGRPRIIDRAGISGPHVGPIIRPGVMKKELRALPQVPADQAAPEPLPVRVPDWFPKPQAAPQAAPAGAPAQIRVHAMAPTAAQNFNGNTGGGPPDVNAAVGPRYVIQTTNLNLGIYDKGTGTQVFYTSLATFFGAGSTGTQCDISQRSDPVALYDAAADRYVITDLSRDGNDQTGHWFQCIAVSQSADPLGSWYFYALGSGPSGPYEANRWLPDYPKLGVWPDGYYMMADMFQTDPCPGGPGCGPGDLWTTYFTTVRVWALNRTAMLTGGAMSPISFDVGGVFSMVPTHMTSANDPPPAGRVNYFGVTDYPDPSVGGTSTTIHIYRFHADFGTPALSTFTGPTNVTVPVYTSPSTAPPMPGTNIVLDTLGTRLMYQFQYRNIGGVESLWGAHAIDSTGGFAATRWYQFNVTGDVIALAPVQAGTTANPDSTHRWMPHLATDQFGNMAIEYSNSSAAVNPGIRYTGRLAGDAPGTLQAEATLFTGPGVFPSCTPTPPATTCGARWGDYSSMQIDPVDDCTFWFTNEYITGGGGSATRIGSARFGGCTCDVEITKSHSPNPVLANGVLTWQLHVTNSGPVGAYSVVVNDTITQPLAATVTAPTGWICTDPGVGNTGLVTCNGPLANGAAVDIFISVTAPNAITSLSDTATVTTGSTNTALGADTTDTDSAIVISPSNVFGTKVYSSSWQFLFPGAPVTYTVVLTNTSANDQFDNSSDEFTDTLPGQLTLVGASATSGSVTTAGNTVHWNGAITGGGSVTITIDALINAGTEGQTVINQGTILYDADGNGSNEATRLTDDPGVGGTQDPTSFQVATPISALTRTGAAAMVILLLVLGALMVLR